MTKTLLTSLLALLGFQACDRNPPTPSSTAAGAQSDAAAPAPTLERPAGFDLTGTRTEAGADRRVEFRSAVAAKRPFSEAFAVIVSTHQRSCKDLAGGYSLAEGETVFRFSAAPAITGGEWGIVDVYFDGKSVLGGRPSGVKVEGTDATKPVKIALTSLALDGFGDSKLSVNGTLVATGCGVVEERSTGPGAPGPARPQETLRLSVAGKPQRVVGAYYASARKQIVLSTSPLSCKSSYSYADVTLLLDADGKSANLQGLRVGGFSGFEAKPPPKITLGPPVGSERKASFQGAFKKDDLTIELSGSAQLGVCD